jgi:hypothetical protein
MRDHVTDNGEVTYKGRRKIVFNGTQKFLLLKSKISFHFTAGVLSYFALQRFEKKLFDEF